MTATTVIGAGVVGASLAYHLARAGGRVTVLDKGLPGGGATARSFAWIGRGPSTVKPEQLALRDLAVQDYQRLEEEVPGVCVRWTGSLTWTSTSPSPDEQGSAGRAVVTRRDALTLEPGLTRPATAAWHSPSDGAIDPVSTVAALLEAAVAYGAVVRTGVAVTRLRVDHGRVRGVHTTDGPVPSDVAVIAAGADAPKLCAPLGYDLPVRPSPSLLMRFSAPPELVRTLVSNDEVEVRQSGDDELLAAWDHEGQTTPGELRRAGEAMLQRLRANFSGARAVELLDVEVGMRPMPVDGSPIIGPLPGVSGVYLAVMHSGVTLAASVGRLVTAEIVQGVRAPELEPLRPARFLPRR